MSRTALGAIAVGAALAAAGCGGSSAPATSGDDAEKAASDGAVRYQQALATGDFEKVCALQTKAKLKQKAQDTGKGGDPRAVCVAYYQKHPELSKSADQPFSVTSVKLTPRTIPLADVTVDTDGDSVVVPMVGHQDEWRVDGEAGAPGFTGTGVDAPADQAKQDAAGQTYSDFRRLLADHKYSGACDLLTKRYRLVRAKSLDKAGVVGTLCTTSYEKDPGAAKEAAAPFDISGVQLKTLTIPGAQLNVTLGDLEGVWYMRFEDGAWRFGGGGLAPPSGGTTTQPTPTEGQKS
ncbi:MAG: hypothetical protein QOG62_1063 [Thermoleophilaceae bacterium]|jgi:hypothetical protein|nr:hypothetical protein [Thermoleophilaceae bacterium]